MLVAGQLDMGSGEISLHHRVAFTILVVTAKMSHTPVGKLLSWLAGWSDYPGQSDVFSDEGLALIGSRRYHTTAVVVWKWT